MSDLTEFLLARFTEEEQVAHAATAGPWRYSPDKAHRGDYEESVFTGPSGTEAVCIASTGPMDDQQSMRDADHIARWDPARVLAECEAKRRIVTRYEFACAQANVSDLGWEAVAGALEDCVGSLAMPYADHPEFQEEWRV